MAIRYDELMTEAKKKANADLADTIKRRKCAAFDYARHLTQLDAEQLRQCGHRGTAIEAAGSHIAKEHAAIMKLIETHERTWP